MLYLPWITSTSGANRVFVRILDTSSFYPVSNQKIILRDHNFVHEKQLCVYLLPKLNKNTDKDIYHL